MATTIIIDWLHLEVGGATCERCEDTGLELRLAVDRLRSECATKGVEILFKETLLPPRDIARSNSILINGKPLEQILPGAQAATSCCPSCGDLTGQAEQCRTLVHLGRTFETIPQDLIRQAVCKVAGCC
ncbi:MAG TPA: molybdenum cofactor biosysynthesis protein [Desulfobulbaceae bacterium]|nr:molybdenum cofactor biosysynthesis protein [Desulfobulbaceae bacterium]